jgi:formylmethanofuran dehydrogenase subunit A
MLHLPHSIHLHFNNTGKPGNYTTALETLDILKDVMPSRMRQVVHVAHMQFSSYGGTSWRDFESKAPLIADYFNRNNHATMDVGQILFGAAMTMTADAPLEYGNARLTHAKWSNHDIELEESSGVVPWVYFRKNLVNDVQWAAGLELALLTIDPWKVLMTTDHPNGSPFVNYPEVIALLMSKSKRTEEMATQHEMAAKRSTLESVERELDWSEIAIMTRAAPAHILGLEDKGHLGVGADADISIYNIRPQEVDASKDHQVVKKALIKALYTIKGGIVVAKDGEILAVPKGKTFWVDAAAPQADMDRLMVDIQEKFNKYYSIQLSNYAVQDAYVTNPAVIKTKPFELESEAMKEAA